MNDENYGPQGSETPATPYYISSTGNGLSLSIGGFSIVGIAQTVVMVARLLGIELTEDIVTSFLVAIVTAGGALMAAYGLGRKVWFNSIKPRLQK